MKKSALSFVKHMEVLSHLGLLKYIDYNKKDLLLRYKNGLERHTKTDFIDFGKLTFFAPIGVYHPYPQSSSVFFVKNLMMYSFEKNPSILEIGTGTGFILLSMAYILGRGKYVGTDIDPTAVRAANCNSDYNELPAKFIKSDLFDNLRDFNFKTVLFNPPFLKNVPVETTDDKVFADVERNIFPRFIEDVQMKFKKGTDVYFSISNLGDVSALHSVKHKLNIISTEVFSNGVMRSLLHMQL